MSKRYKTIISIAMVVLLAATVAAVIVSSMSAVNKEKDRREQELRSVAKMVEASAVSSFVKPLTVSNVMANDVNLKNLLKEAENNPYGVEEYIAIYLNSLKSGLGYRMLYAVCDKSGAYYTCDGITTNIYADTLENSKWYSEFLDTGKDVEFNVDIEKSTDWDMSVFVNHIIRDDEKNIIGVVGTAVEVSQLQTILEKYERIYDVKIDIVDNEGLIQIDTNTDRIQKEYVEIPKFSLISDGETYYEKSDDGDRVIVYMDDLDMYLIAASTQNETVELLKTIGGPLTFLVVGALIALGLIMYATIKEKKDGFPAMKDRF